MKGVSALKSKNVDSPKTPGGISRSLLTPCRRVGLSRNWKKSGASPFQSPLSSNSEVKHESVTRKRKGSSDDNTTHNIPENDAQTSLGVALTPTRNVELPRRKRSKTLLVAINNLEKEPSNNSSEEKVNSLENEISQEIKPTDTFNVNVLKEANEAVSSPVRLKSKSKNKKKISPSNSTSEINHKDIKECMSDNNTVVNNENNMVQEDNTECALSHLNKSKSRSKKKNSTMEIMNNEENVSDTTEVVDINHKGCDEDTKKKSPNNLAKECIVVLQKKIFKKELKTKEKTQNHNEMNNKTTSQTLFDSDSDDIPLVQLNKKEMSNKDSNDKDDFATKPKITKVDKSSITKSKSPKYTKNRTIGKVITVHKPPISQNSDDDDDFVDNKKTILIRKSYDKVMKPQKAKSTGSITQRDIDELKARIETKKKMLLAKAMTEDTKELKDLIKKWQKGCQDALMELMDLMKTKMPDKQNMDYSEILQTLKIPASLVGYDSDNDCFLTPNDEDVVLARFKD